ncbi:class I SAM-dependent methyltransferase [Phormidium sp. CLA17]|uniref:SAM-dependent methyltransferase n=1 Tax=Leptolyngbya sp. Cla-17 TaxID=2803751 RepID=UPI001491A77B|nr:class I SAM-dependent methyltransferase [Leptolyngbya sp. Cla-17]MBM0741161.1 class I SAM-dependent methyltransferase [Leptolyngbya sp. Cla-17]
MTQHKPDIGFIPTPPAVIEGMLELLQVTSQDVVYDLGCGDGRILITAAQRFGAHGVGIDVDPNRIQAATANAIAAGVSDRVTFHHQNLYESDFSPATIVILYLLTHLNLKLKPQLFQQLKPGTRIVSHDFDMGNWTPDQVIQIPIEADEIATLYYWVMPDYSVIGDQF